MNLKEALRNKIEEERKIAQELFNEYMK